MALETVFSGNEDFFSTLPMDLDDLFSDDMINFLGSEFALPEPVMDCPMPSMIPAAAESSGAGPSPSYHGSTASPEHSSGTSSSMFQVGAPLELAIQRCAGPPTAAKNAKKRGPVRLVTTEVPPEVKVQQEVVKPRAPPSNGNFSSEEDSDSDGSNDTDEYAVHNNSSTDVAASKKPNKRKAPEVDWRSISDPSERRRQRRLAKNRVTAARSRDRKKVQWAELEAKLSNLDNDNKRLKAMLAELSRENGMLRGQLAGIAQGDEPGSSRGKSHSTEPAVFVFISILLLLCCSLPSDKAMLLGSAAPLVLLALMQLSNCQQGDMSLSESILHFVASIRTLLARSSKRLRSSVHKMLFSRHHYMGRRVLHDTAKWAMFSSCPLLASTAKVKVKGEVCSHTVKEEPCCDMVFNPLPFLVSGVC